MGLVKLPKSMIRSRWNDVLESPMKRKEQDEYDTKHSAAVPLGRALKDVLSKVIPVQETERVPLMKALGRTLAVDVRSQIDVPGHANSAMDGYAVRHADTAANGSVRLHVAGESFAGHPYSAAVAPGECVRIMTGAVLPDGADTVVMQEDVIRSGDTIVVRGGVRIGDNVRKAGEDIQAGARILGAGKRLRPADLGLLASIGTREITVTRRVKVAYFSTGDELSQVGERLETGHIYDSNQYTLRGLLEEAGVAVIDFGIIRDDLKALSQALRNAAISADVVVTSGGVSAGKADYMVEVYEDLGRVEFRQIALKPGHPFIYGQVGSASVFGLPGNPVSAMVTFLQVVRPALDAMSGMQYTPPIRFRVRAQEQLRKKPGRTEFQRGVLVSDKEGEPGVRTTGYQGSGILRSMSEADCLIVMEEERGAVGVGDRVWVELL